MTAVRAPGTATDRAAATAALLDLCGVLAFVIIGRHTHHDGDTLAGIWHTAWPFLTGLAIGLATARAWRRPLNLAPAGIGAADIERVLFEILEIAESELRKASLDDLRRSMDASIACRAAIKINMRLEPEKIDWLLRALAATSCPMSCPHGRPIALRYSTRDILKSFHRI